MEPVALELPLDLESGHTKPFVPAPYVILTEDDLRATLDYFLRQDAFAFDVETWGPHRGSPMRNDVLWIALATHDMTVVIPMGHPNGDNLLRAATKRKNKITGKFDMIPAVYDEPPAQLSPGTVFDILEPLFFSDNIVKIAHNATFDLLSIAKYYGGNIPPGPYRDTIVEAWLLDENRPLRLKALTEGTYGHHYDDEGVGKKVEIHPFGRTASYQYWDVRYTWLLDSRQVPEIQAAGLERAFRMEMDVLVVLLDMVKHGVTIDMDALRALDGSLAVKVVELEGLIYQTSPGGFDADGKIYTPGSGGKFNLNSPQQKAKILWGPSHEDYLGLSPTTLTPGGKAKQKAGTPLLPTDYSTDAESLEPYRDTVPLVGRLLDYQETNKLLGTYVRAYLGTEEDEGIVYKGRLHTDYAQYGTVTGRMSSRRPNIQNVPAPDSELGRAVRGLFIPSPGNKLVVADYGQIELVILAHYAGPGKLWDGFFAGIDAHTATAAALFGIAPEQVEKSQRKVSKAIAFAINYGAGPDKVASMAGITVAEAKKFLKLHQKLFPEIYIFKERCIARARERGYIRTLSGRYRRLPDINHPDRALRGRAERQTLNSLIQGGNADITKIAMIRAHATLPEDMHLILTVHDELVVDTPADRAEECVEILREAMVGESINALLRTPMRADIKIVQRWSEAK